MELLCISHILLGYALLMVVTCLHSNLFSLQLLLSLFHSMLYVIVCVLLELSSQCNLCGSIMESSDIHISLSTCIGSMKLCLPGGYVELCVTLSVGLSVRATLP